MNILEQYIEEVHEEKPYEAEWTKKYDQTEFVQVDVTTNCYGRTKRTKEVFTKHHWEKYKEQGYFMA